MRYILSSLLLLALCVPSKSSAALVGYTDFTAFTAAAVGPQEIINFDSLAVNSVLNTIGTVTFSEANGEDLTVFNTFGADYTVSPVNYIGDGFGPEQLTDEEVVEFDFAPGAERSAVGLFVQYDPSNITNDGVLQLTANGVTVQVDEFDGIDFTPLDFFDDESAFFIGLVEDTGANTISMATLDTVGVDTISYTFDNFTTHQVAAAVPEPSSLAGLILMVTCSLVRRRKR